MRNVLEVLAVMAITIVLYKLLKPIIMKLESTLKGVREKIVHWIFIIILLGVLVAFIKATEILSFSVDNAIKGMIFAFLVGGICAIYKKQV